MGVSAFHHGNIEGEERLDPAFYQGATRVTLGLLEEDFHHCAKSFGEVLGLLEAQLEGTHYHGDP